MVIRRAFAGLFVVASVVPLACSEGSTELVTRDEHAQSAAMPVLEVVAGPQDLPHFDFVVRGGDLSLAALVGAEPALPLDSALKVSRLDSAGELIAGGTIRIDGLVEGGDVDAVEVRLDALRGGFTVPVVEGAFTLYLQVPQATPGDNLSLKVRPIAAKRAVGTELVRTLTLYPAPPSAAGKKVQVVLSWAARTDLDLSLQEPSGGERISISNDESAAGGALTADCNHFCEFEETSYCKQSLAGTSGAFNEEIVFVSSATGGSYDVYVRYWSVCDTAPLTLTPFTVTINLRGGATALGGVTKTCSGVLTPRDENLGEQLVCSFSYCAEGACCTAVPCNAPPDDFCATPATALNDYAASGTCSTGVTPSVCNYPVSVVPCAYGCVTKAGDDACGPNRCASVTCPLPIDRCSATDPNKLDHQAAGVCNAATGVCSYAFASSETCPCSKPCVDRPGADSCQSPCETYTCPAERPVVNDCQSGNAVVYGQGGTCTASACVTSCTYPVLSTTSCGTKGCVNGHCRECSVVSDCPGGGSGYVCSDGFCKRLSLFFREHVQYTSDYDTHELWARKIKPIVDDSTNPKDGSWTRVADKIVLQPTTGSTWVDRGPINLSAYYGSSFRLALRYNAYNGDNWSVDDVCLAETSSNSTTYPTSCPWSQQFDSAAAPALPTGWTSVAGSANTSTGPEWVASTAQARSVPNSARVEYNGSARKDYYLVSPPFTVLGNGDQCNTALSVNCTTPPDDECSADRASLNKYATGTCVETAHPYACAYVPEAATSGPCKRHIDADHPAPPLPATYYPMPCRVAAGDDFCAECVESTDCAANQVCSVDGKCVDPAPLRLFYNEMDDFGGTLSYYGLHELWYTANTSSTNPADGTWTKILTTTQLKPALVDNAKVAARTFDLKLPSGSYLPGGPMRLAFHYKDTTNSDHWHLDDLCISRSYGRPLTDAQCSIWAENFNNLGIIVAASLSASTGWTETKGATDDAPASTTGGWKGAGEGNDYWVKNRYDSSYIVDRYLVTPVINNCDPRWACCTNDNCTSSAFPDQCANATTWRDYPPTGVCQADHTCFYNPSGFTAYTCPTGYTCQTGSCCNFDEPAVDGKNDLILAGPTTGARCWRHCLFPNSWNGVACTTNPAGAFSRSAAADACAMTGPPPYTLPSASDFQNLLGGCAAVTGGWQCSACKNSPACKTAFGNSLTSSTDWVWTSTVASGTYYYTVNLDTGLIKTSNPSTPTSSASAPYTMCIK